MRAVIQRVSEAKVVVDGFVKGEIGAGLLVLLAVEEGDESHDVEWMSGKIARMRIFPDEEGRMNNSIQETGGEVLVVSQFTLYASTRKGNRPSFTRSARTDVAVPLYEQFLRQMVVKLGKSVASGQFGADMKVSLVNDGPVTILLDSKNPE